MLLITWLTFVSLLNAGRHVLSKSVCKEFGYIGCNGYDKYIFDPNVTMYTHNDCHGNTQVLPTCPFDDGLSSKFISDRCKYKWQCEFGISVCQFGLATFKSAEITYYCGAPRRYIGQYSYCFNFGRISCDGKLIKVKKVQYFYDTDCSGEKRTVDECSEDSTATSLDILSRRCDGSETCDIAILRCPETSWWHESTAIEYDCVEGTTTTSPTIKTDPPSTTEAPKSQTTESLTTQSTSRSFMITGGENTTQGTVTVVDKNVDTKSSPSMSQSSQIGPIVGGVVGGFLLAHTAVAIILMCIRYRRQKGMPPKKIEHNAHVRSQREESEYEQQYEQPTSIHEMANGGYMGETGEQQDNVYFVLNGNTKLTTESYVESPEPPLDGEQNISCMHNSTKHMNASTDKMAWPLRKQNANIDNYFVLEAGCDERPVVTTHVRASNVGNTSVVANENSYNPEAENPENRYSTSVYELETDIDGSDNAAYELETDNENSRGKDGPNYKANNAPSDQYGYSHISGVQLSVPNADLTYNHVTDIGNDVYGYANHFNIKQTFEQVRSPRLKPARTVNSNYSMCINPIEADYDILGNT